MVKVRGKDRDVDIVTLQDLDKFKDLILAYPELSKVRKFRVYRLIKDYFREAQ